MLHYLLKLLSVDERQWRALLRASLKLDLRQAHIGAEQSQSGLRAFWFLLISSTIFGILLAVLILNNHDLFATGIVFFTTIAILSAVTILTEFHSVVLSPEDYAILSYQPITSRTYFFARLANLLIYVSSLTTALSLAPVLAYSFTLGFNPLLGLITAGLAYLSTFSVTLVLVLSYALILKVVPAHRLQRALGYFQLATSFVIYGGYLLIAWCSLRRTTQF